MNRRGQATVELALGILLLIPVLLLGIHFAEVGALTLRVNQAAAAAIWDTTGTRMHNLSAGTFRNSDAMTIGGQAPDVRATALYKSFDGLAAPGATTITQALTMGSSLSVSCAPAKVMKTPVAPAGRDFSKIFAGYSFAKNAAGNKVDGMSCSATGRVTAVSMPSSFVEGSGGLFNASLLSRTSFKVCAIGRPDSSGNCQGKLEIALDDWALSGHDDTYGKELQNCGPVCLSDPGVGNQAFKNTVKRVFEQYDPDTNAPNSTVIHQYITELFTQNPSVPGLTNLPVNENDLRLAFVGEEGDMGEAAGTRKRFKLPTREVDATQPTPYVDYHWETTPGADPNDDYGTAYGNRGECFLGSDCGKPLFDKTQW